MRKRDHGVFLRMTTAEMELFKEKLTQSGLTQTAFVIKSISGAQIASTELAIEMRNQSRLIMDLFSQIRRIGVNINQLAKVANQTGNITAINELQRSTNELIKLHSEIKNLTDAIN